MAIKLDMAKAYDRIEWDFLLGMMSSLGFAPLFCNWIKECISSVSFSVLINGSPTGLFRPNRDDSVVFGNASVEEAGNIVDVLKTYARGSGQEINLTKSSIFFGANTSKKMRANIADFGHSKKAVFAEIRDKIEARLSGWAEQFLSQAGKEILVKTVAMALPNYAMSCFKLPIGVCRDVERAIRNYWWRGNEQRKGIHWISWDRLMKQKKAGGLGFKDIQCVNLAFLAKIGWRITLNPMSLLASVLRDKYFPGKSFGEAPKGKNTSWGWKGLFEARKVLNQGLRWRVGNGKSINIREDPWFPKPATFKVRPMNNLGETMVSDLIDSDTKVWRSDLIVNGFHRDDASTILSIPLSHAGSNDRLVWHYATNGIYSVKTGYSMALKLMDDGALGRKGRGNPSESNKLKLVWNNIWRMQGRDFLESWCNFWNHVKDRTDADDISQDFAFDTLRMGVGWLGRDFAGLLQAAGGSGTGFSHSAAAAEASAIRFALLSCIDHGFDDIIVESDASTIILMLKKEIVADFSIECILEDIEVLAQQLRSVSFAFVPREGNRAVHSVAKYVFKEGRSFSWDCIGPEFLFNLLAKDVNLSIRL
ncbi:unnamed protein product [Malus baccata var. baccata]